MPALIDARPAGVNVQFRPGTTLTVTLNWPTGALAGRTFTSTLDGATLGLQVAGDLMTITATVAQTATITTGAVWLLTETTGDDQPIMAGIWAPSTRPSATSSQTVQVTQGAAQVAVAVAGVNAAVVTLTVAGQASFAVSPLVPNPAAVNPLAAASIGEVQTLIAQSSAGFIKSMDPKAALLPVVSNSTTETSVLNAVLSMPAISHGAVFRMVAWGICRATAGGPVNMTLRLRNTTDAVVLGSAVAVLATDADTARPWRFEVVGEGNVVLADAVPTAASLVVGAGSGGDPLKHVMDDAAPVKGTDPQNWDVTVQFSVANAGITANVYGAQLLYALPGA